MKRYFVFGLILMFVVAACSPSGEGESGEETAVSNEVVAIEEVGLAEDYDDALSVPAQLTLGTLMLEGTDLAVDEVLAAEILPLWQAVQSLGQSDVTADGEITAVLNQIQDAMTAEQISTISGMQLTGDDVETYLQESGFGRGFGGRGAGEEGEGGAPAGGGGRQAGGIPGGGGGPGSGGRVGGGFGGDIAIEELTEEEIAELFAERLRSGEQLLNPVINLLREKTGEMMERPLGGRGFMGIIAEATGLSNEDIQGQLVEGKTMAELITENGGDLEAVRAQLTEMFSNVPNADTDPADIEQRIDDLLNSSEGFGNRGG